jgi:radical SAM superfamily enzyme YgiQ (UPF0313 family)
MVTGGDMAGARRRGRDIAALCIHRIPGIFNRERVLSPEKAGVHDDDSWYLVALTMRKFGKGPYPQQSGLLEEEESVKILLVSPCAERDKQTAKVNLMPQLALYLLAGLTPEEHEVRILEENVEPVDLDTECDLVGISCMTANAPRGYQIAAEFRKRGKKVVMGGVHPTVMPGEARLHADSVVVGEAEGVWRDLLADAAAGKLKPLYHKPEPSLEEYVHIRHREMKRKRLFGVIPVMTTRGCPYDCEFCSVTDLFGKKVRHVPVDNVVRDIDDSGGKFYMFLDDNIVGHRKYARELFSAIAPLKIRWVGQASLSFASDEGLMKLAADSGCIGLFFGLESVSKKQLETMRKSIKEIDKIEDAIRRIKGHGIAFHPSLIFGFDEDTEDIFPDTLDFLERNRIFSLSLNTLTPYPGTRVYDRFKKEGRLLTEDWQYYDHKTVVFTPKKLTPYQLQAGRLWVFNEFTRLTGIAKRLPYNLDHLALFTAMSLGRRKVCRGEMREFPDLVRRHFPGDAHRLSGNGSIQALLHAAISSNG